MTAKPAEFDAREPAALAGAAAVLVGLGLAAWNAWTADAAFITFRYARNLVEGHGLVFNVGERVDGLKNPLWALWIALGMVFRVSPESWGVVSGVIAAAIILVLLLAFHLDLRGRLPVRKHTLPVACLATALHPDFSLFTTSGLETSAFMASVFVGYWMLVSGLTGGTPRPILSALLFGVSTLLRPDGLVFGAVAFLLLLITPPRRAATAMRFLLCLAAILGFAAAVRHLYYGAGAASPYEARFGGPARGFAYLGTYLQKYWVLFLSPFTIDAALWKGRGALLRADASPDPLVVHALAASAFAVAYTGYVVCVGGSATFARLLIPVTPYLAILLELALCSVSFERPFAYVELVIAALAVPMVTPRPTSGVERRGVIVNEYAKTDENALRVERRDAAVLSHFFGGLAVRVAFADREARLVFDANAPFAIDGGRAIHLGDAGVRYLVATFRPHFLLTSGEADRIDVSNVVPNVLVHLGPVTVRALRWDPALMKALGARGASFPDFVAYLDRYIRTMNGRSGDEVRSDYRKFRLFYFDGVQDPERRTAFEDRLHRE